MLSNGNEPKCYKFMRSDLRFTPFPSLILREEELFLVWALSFGALSSTQRSSLRAAPSFKRLFLKTSHTFIFSVHPLFMPIL